MKGIGDCIRRADAIEAMYKDAEAHPDHTFWTTQHEALRNIPAADVRPVRRGKWLPIIEGNEYGETYQTGCYCSECNEVLQHEPNFCPNCGADMRRADDV